MNYGPVKFINGPLAGKNGYYDDDKNKRLAIVYLGDPFKSDYVVVPKNQIASIQEPPQKVDLKGAVTRRLIHT